MLTCPKCNKYIDCAFWSTLLGKYMCVKNHEASDCEGMDDLYYDFNNLSKISP